MYSIAYSYKKLIVFIGFILFTCSLFSQKGNFPFYDFAGIYNFGDIIPKDQGGKFVQVELLNTENDAIIVHKIRNGLLYEKFGNLRSIFIYYFRFF